MMWLNVAIHAGVMIYAVHAVCTRMRLAQAGKDFPWRSRMMKFWGLSPTEVDRMEQERNADLLYTTRQRLSERAGGQVEYGINFLPHDASYQRLTELTEGSITFQQMLENLLRGHRFEIIPRILEVTVGIQQTRMKMAGMRGMPGRETSSSASKLST